MPEDDEVRNEGRSLGGKARAKAMSGPERAESARNAALARWSADMPQATHDGPLNLAGYEIFAAVLPNGKRLLTQSTMLLALARSRTPKGGTGALNTAVDGLPFFLQAENLKPFISDDLRLSTTPILFRSKTGQRAVGYEAELLPKVCEVYLQLRDSYLASGRPVPGKIKHIVTRCDALVRALATVGIVALVDEATGYQDVRDRQALQAILDAYLRAEHAKWAKRFPDEFYREIFRLRNWTWRGMSVNRPQAVAGYTKDIVYERLAPGLLKELEARNPILETGQRKSKHHTWLTDDIGHPALNQHLFTVIKFMQASTDWDGFMRILSRAFPKKGQVLFLPGVD